jgi:hypothetical protein
MTSILDMLGAPLWEITKGRLDHTTVITVLATNIAMDRGCGQIRVSDFEDAVDGSPSITRGSTRNPFRRH